MLSAVLRRLATHAHQATGYRCGVSAQIFRLPRLAYAVVLFLLVGAIPLAFTRDGTEGSAAGISVRTLVLVLPALAIAFIARTATIVDDAGIRVRALFGERMLPWTSVRGLSVSDRTVYAVLDEGAMRLPCVRVADLAALSRASGGHVPQLPDAPVKAGRMSRRSQRH
jgi:hypothetical protein